MAARALLLFASLFLAAQAGASNEFQVRIDIVSQCGPQQTLFGPRAAVGPLIVCQSSTTSFRSQEISLASTSNAASLQKEGEQAEGEGEGESDASSAQSTEAGGGVPAAFTSPARLIMYPPLPAASANSAQKVIYVVF